MTPFQYVVLAPTNWAFVVFGELDKAVPLSRVRFGALHVTERALTWAVRGGAGEEVRIFWARAETKVLESVVCTLTQGEGTLSCGAPHSATKCVCV